MPEPGEPAEHGPSDAFDDDRVDGGDFDEWDDSADHRDDYADSYPDEPWDHGPPDYAGPVDEGDADWPVDDSGRPAAQASLRSTLSGGGHRGRGRWQGGHRSESGRRGVSIGVVSALVTVIVVVAAVILWRFFGDALSNRSNSAAGLCVDGKETIAVIADPSIADHVQEFADRYNGAPVTVGDHCELVRVKPAGSDAVINGFIGTWPAELGDRPALWIPGSSVSVARLAAAIGQQAISDSRSLVTSPVLIAIRPELQPALAKQTWATLPGLQTAPDALAGLNLPSWGSLRLALPISGNSDAAYLAAEAVAVASAPPGEPATAGSGAVRALVNAQPKLTDNSVAEAMNVLLEPGDPAISPVHAVVTTEQHLFQRSHTVPNAGHVLGSWLPPGPAAVADYPTALLRGSWLSPEQVTAASAFARFMHKPEQLTNLAEAGFRAQGVTPPSSDVAAFAALPPTLSVGDEAVRAALADTLTAPASGPAATIMIDQSMPTEEAGATRLSHVIAALKAELTALPPNSIIGLWTFDGTEGRTEVPTGPLDAAVDGRPRSAALTAALDKQHSTPGGDVSFTTLRLVYQAAKAKFSPDHMNSVLVITAGPHTDKTLDGPGLQDYIRGAVDPAQPVAVNIIDFGDDPDRPTWEAVAQLSGGSYRNLATSASPELSKTIAAFLA